MPKVFQQFTKRYATFLGVITGLAVISSVLFYSGCGMTSSSPSVPTNPTPIPDNARPTSIITFPTAAGIVSTSATVNITGTASDTGGGSVRVVEVSVDGGATWNQASGTSAWSYSWLPTQSGPAIIRSRAIDNSGNVQEPPAQITATVQDGTRPTSTITSPADGATIKARTTFTIAGNASDTGGGFVLGVEVSVDGGATWNQAMGTSAWEYFWSPTLAGPTKIRSRAIDSWGNRQDPPAEVNITVVADTTPPTSRITFPAEGAIVIRGTAINITGTASDADDGIVTSVEVSVDGGRFYNPASGTSDWNYRWVPFSLGPTTIKSRARDNSENRQDPPEQINVTVVEQPTVTSREPANGDADVSTLTNVRANFNKEMDPATVNESTVELLAPSNAPVPATVSYSAINRSVTLNPTEPLTPGTTYTARVRGGDTDPRAKDLDGIALAADVTWTFTTGIAPQVLSTTPAGGATDVLTGAALRATFSKELWILSLLDTGAVQLQDSAGNQISHDVSVTCCDAPTTVVIVPRRMLQPLQTYKVTFKGGPDEPHVTDLAGTPMDSDYTWSFTTSTEPPPMAVFAPDDRPLSSSDDPSAVEIGLKFRSDVDGLITGVRFYKRGPTNGGEHVGHLWTSDGTMLGSVTFNSETERGWQQALFQTPIPITADTTYVVSYFAPQGNYSANSGQFASSGVDAPPLHALQDGVDGGNGVYLYSPTGGFPTQTINSTNYWVDVVFGDPTVSAPQVISTTPAPGAGFLFITGLSTLTVTFSEPIDPATVNASTVMLTDTAGAPIPFTISFGADNFTVILTPQDPLQMFGAYTVTLKGGGDAPHITDATGTPLAADFTWSFTIIF
jgi:uncharacterized protein DUF4082/Big-like domain-containing protein